MSDQGEKTCPLCAEEMDLTDQQLKPCKCGYEICVWCWHHVMDMAEKDDSEGRCPACRTPYDKEKIVGTAAKCGRLVAEVNMEKKKSQKAKSKTSEGRKQLSSVRVIQRNLVYIVGLPLSLADEDILQRREYFGQYGRVLKVSISRTAAGSIQQFPNSTCSVYITYSKEDEAVRCIQTVHGFTLDGRSLRACFGTTKYCHAWLRNVPCTNPECLYLHEVGSHEDSFTKDEIISAYTRSRVQQITGSNNIQRRSGSSLPPPLDEYCQNSHTSAARPISKNASNNLGTVKGASPNGSCGRSAALPAAASWGTRASNCSPSATTLPCSNGPLKQKPETSSGSIPSSSVTTHTSVISKPHSDLGKKLPINDESQTLQTKGKLESDSMRGSQSVVVRATASETAVTLAGSSTVSLSGHLPCRLASNDNVRCTSPQPSVDLNGKSCNFSSGNAIDATNKKTQGMCSLMSSMSIDKQPHEQPVVPKPNHIHSTHVPIKSIGSGGLQPYPSEQLREPLTSLPDAPPASSTIVGVSREKYDLRLNSRSHVQDGYSDVHEGLLSFDNQKFSNVDVNNNKPLPSPRDRPMQSRDAFSFGANTPIVDKRSGEGLSNGYLENPADLDRTTGRTHLLPNGSRTGQLGRFDGERANICDTAATDLGESSIISNILSMDFDAWDDSLTSPQNLAKLLGENDKQHGSVKRSSSWKVQNSNQSRFSFAREEESRHFLFDAQPKLNNHGQHPLNMAYAQNFGDSREPHPQHMRNGTSPSIYAEEFNNLVNNHPVLSSSKLSVPRAQVSAPPGFSVPSRAPPPGFLSHERMEQAFDTATGNQLLEASPLLRNPYHVPENVNMSSNGDIEFMDPAILAVGKGRLPGGINNMGLDMRSSAPQQYSSFEDEARLHLLMQRSLSPHQNLRFTDISDKISPLGDSYGIPSRLMDQSQNGNLPPFPHVPLQQSRNGLTLNGPNGHWDGWSDLHNGNNMGMAELLRNERLGYNKIYTGYEDSKFRMANSGDLYNRTFGM